MAKDFFEEEFGSQAQTIDFFEEEFGKKTKKIE